MFEGQRGMGVVPVGDIPDALALLRGEISPREPIAFRQALGRVPRDLMMGGDPALLLISEHFRSTLTRAGFSGWATYPVAVSTRRGEIVSGYSGLSVTGRSRRVPGLPFLAGIASLGSEEGARQTRAGADLCLDGGSSLVVVTARVRDALRAARVGNVSFVPVG